MGTSSFLTMTKCFAEFRVRRRGKIEVVNRRDRRVAIYSSRSARAAAARGRQGTKRSAAFSKKRQSLFFEITSSRLRAGP